MQGKQDESVAPRGSRERQEPEEVVRTGDPQASRVDAEVVRFRPRHAVPPVRAGHDDDDPGPAAA